ncbi:aminoacyl-tRNA hydrolase [Egicoccus halophilus]|uniref:Peptidyl-tRNA hydrolase n=1 Tax=Egicoccus halophilus TaxID=1670830 RepID=A0A8J3EWI3_9ACTN|nr:aminoacyl-tRNA hydrolase [Egicoccus halophilus]GGI03715.1 peptidyl-tRNA hydrolase [Egicoccus halophilus]
MADDDRWLVVGLGNPEAEYGGTRHNVGADAVRRFAVREHAPLSRNKRARCETAETVVAGVRFALAIPQSYMNTSGGPAQQAATWFKVPVERTIVLHDELDVDLGALKIKRGGGAGGHNGLRDLDRAFGSREYLRVRIGIGRPPGRMAGKDFVLRRFSPAEREIVDVTLEEACDAVVLLATQGLEPTQNRYHGTR